MFTGWRPQKSVKNTFPASTIATFPTDPLLNINEISRRLDMLLPDGTDIVKEHAKLVQDINSLRQVVFVAPLVDEHKDYEDSIFHEIIETYTTTTTRPTTTKPYRPTRASSIPVILVGGASQRQVVKSQPIKFPKPTISLVGTSASPLMKHPYPFVVQASSRKPIKVCMTSMPMMYQTTTRRPSLWQRLLNTLIPR